MKWPLAILELPSEQEGQVTKVRPMLSNLPNKQTGNRNLVSRVSNASDAS